MAYIVCALVHSTGFFHTSWLQVYSYSNLAVFSCSRELLAYNNQFKKVLLRTLTLNRAIRIWELWVLIERI